MSQKRNNSNQQQAHQLRLINKIKRKLSWIWEDIIWMLLKHLFKSKSKNQLSNITIGITTFLDRYHNCLIPLVKKLVILFPTSQIIVIANGHVKKQDQLVYLKNIQLFCNKYSNVELHTYVEPMGLSFLWNQIIIYSKTESLLILNDDVKIKHSFPKWIFQQMMDKNKIFTINRSWSHFLISKEIVEIVGFFDEGLLEIGGEDDDYAARLAISQIYLHNFFTSSISEKLKLKQKRLSLNSYGKNMNKESHGYSSFNNYYLSEKWEMSKEPFDGATEVPNRSIDCINY
jgi:hypothetical protein